VSSFHYSYPFDRVYLIIRQWRYVSNCRVIFSWLNKAMRSYLFFLSDVIRNLYNVTVRVTSDLSGGNKNGTWYDSKSLVRGTLSVSSD